MYRPPFGLVADHPDLYGCIRAYGAAQTAAAAMLTGHLGRQIAVVVSDLRNRDTPIRTDIYTKAAALTALLIDPYIARHIYPS